MKIKALFLLAILSFAAPAQAFLPYIFSSTPGGNVPASQLDTNFNDVGAMGITQCSAIGTNTIALTPLSNQPAVISYNNYQQFSFVAQNTSTGSVNANVNTVGSKPLYLPDGLTQVGLGQIVAGQFYQIAYNSALGASGGFILNGFYNGAQVVSAPMGRLTLSSTLPVLTADLTAQAALYYLPYAGNYIPIYNGTNFVTYQIPAGMTMNLDSNSGHTGYQQSTKLFDVFVFSNAGTPQLCTGPAWTNSTTRASAISQVNGIWVNTSSQALKVDNSSFSGTLAANQGTYVGTMYATANGQTGVAFKPSAAAGGSNNIIGIWNSYNRVAAKAVERDSSGGWTTTSTSWQGLDNSASNRISLVDGLGVTPIKAHLGVMAGNSTIAALSFIGIDLNSISNTPNIGNGSAGATGTLANNYTALNVEEGFYPSLGFNFYQSMQIVTSGTATYSPSTQNALVVDTEY